MGNSNGKKAVTGEDLEFLRNHTSLTQNDQAMYENFIVKHPDGTIARKEFRLLNLLSISLHKLAMKCIGFLNMLLRLTCNSAELLNL